MFIQILIFFVFLLGIITLFVCVEHLWSRGVQIMSSKMSTISQKLSIAYHVADAAVTRTNTSNEGSTTAKNLDELAKELLEAHRAIQKEIEDTLNSDTFRSPNKSKCDEEYIREKVKCLNYSLEDMQQRLLTVEKAQIHMRDSELKNKVDCAISSYNSYIEKLNAPNAFLNPHIIEHNCKKEVKVGDI